jgi:WD40 repeat protein
LWFVDNMNELKSLETAFFEGVKFESSLLFGGTLGSKSGGVTAFAVTPNGRLLAQAINNGTILVYDTKEFDLVRIFTAVPPTQFMSLEFSRDNFSQLIALTQDGYVRSFLLKGPSDCIQSSPYFDSSLVPSDRRPLSLLPFYDLSFLHLTSSDFPLPDSQSLIDFKPTATCLHPHMSFTGFQHQVMLATKSGQVMKWNANVNPSTLKHEGQARLYG